MDQAAANTIIKIPKGLPTLLCANTNLRKAIGVWLQLKAMHPGGRFKADLRTLQTNANACGIKTFKTLEKYLYACELKGLAWKKDKCIHLATWPVFLKAFGLPFKTPYRVEAWNDDQPIWEILDQYFMMEEKDFFEKCKTAKEKQDKELQYTLQSVCSTRLRKDEIIRSQLHLFCKTEPGFIGEEAEYMLLYARNKDGRFYYKADTHISTQHYSKRMGYKNKNGFCYKKKKMQKTGLIIVTRREEVISKGLRTDLDSRYTGLGTVFRDNKSCTTKLRMVDAIKFLKPGIKLSASKIDSVNPAKKAA